MWRLEETAGSRQRCARHDLTLRVILGEENTVAQGTCIRCPVHGLARHRRCGAPGRGLVGLGQFPGMAVVPQIDRAANARGSTSRPMSRSSTTSSLRVSSWKWRAAVCRSGRAVRVPDISELAQAPRMRAITEADGATEEAAGFAGGPQCGAHLSHEIERVDGAVDPSRQFSRTALTSPALMIVSAPTTSTLRSPGPATPVTSK
jgi:hypothetical protein